MILSTSNNRKNLNHSFNYNGDKLEQMEKFKFLGNIISQNGNLIHSAQELAKKTMKVMYSIKTYCNSIHQTPVNLSNHLFNSLVIPILTYNSEIWYMDAYSSFYKASIKRDKNNKKVDTLNFIDKSPPDKVLDKFNKLTLGVKKCSCNIAARSELGSYPIDCFIKRQTLLFHDRLLREETSPLLKDTLNLAKTLHNAGIYSWYSYVNHVRSQNDLEIVNQNKDKNNRLIYKQNLENSYDNLYNDKILNLQENSKLQLFKKI